MDAMQIVPRRIKEAISDIFTKNREEQEARRKMHGDKKRSEFER
jgi:hypothetical protein